MSSRKIEMTWRCAACGNENLGRFKVCQTCGDPKDASEKFEMPSDTRAAATVTDPALLRKANAGKDWRCDACGANQSALGDRCSQCGSPRPGVSSAAQPSRPAQGSVAWDPVAELFRATFRLLTAGIGTVFFGAGALIVVLLAGGVVFAIATGGPRDVPVTVVEHRWARVVDVERYAVRDEEGFAEVRPADAFDLRSLGDRHHHDEQVLDHYETVTYTEQVRDGYDTVWDNVQVQCGEDCTTTAPTCTETCSPDDNGFATCTESCWGGGESCTPRYCTEQRSREVERWRTELRTREEPRYRSEPRYAEYFAWHAWRWRHARTLDAAGTGLDAAWPDDAAIALDVGLADGEDERDARRATYVVVFESTDEERRRWDWTAPDEHTWRAFAPGSAHVLRMVGRSDTIDTIDPPPAPE